MVPYITSETEIYTTLKSYKDIVCWSERTDKVINEQIVIDIIGEVNKSTYDGGVEKYIAQEIQVMHICRLGSLDTRADFSKFMKSNFNYNFQTNYTDDEEYFISVYRLEHMLKEWV